MKLVEMRPQQLQKAVATRIPLLMAAGVVEYHGPHLPLGTDLMIAQSVCDEVEKRCPCVLAPSFPFGPTLAWAGLSAEGEMDFEPEPFFQYAKEAFRSYVRMGFRRIYVLQFHQGSNGLQALCLKRAAVEVIRELAQDWGEGWGRKGWGNWPIPDIFNLITVAGPDEFSRTPDGQEIRLPLGHASKGETQFIMAVQPNTVDMAALNGLDEQLNDWIGDAREADPREGKEWLDICSAGWVKELSRDKS